MSELIFERRLKTSDRCSEVTSDAFRNRDRKSLTFFEYRSAPVGPIAETDLTSFSKAVSSAIIERAVAAVTASELKTAAEKHTARAIRVQILIFKVPRIGGHSHHYWRQCRVNRLIDSNLANSAVWAERKSLTICPDNSSVSARLSLQAERGGRPSVQTTD